MFSSIRLPVLRPQADYQSAIWADKNKKNASGDVFWKYKVRLLSVKMEMELSAETDKAVEK